MCSGLVVQVVSALLHGNWQDFNWHDASRGPSAIAELLVVNYNKGDYDALRAFIKGDWNKEFAADNLDVKAMRNILKTNWLWGVIGKAKWPEIDDDALRWPPSWCFLASPTFFWGGGRQKYLNARDAEPLSLVKNARLGKRYPHARNWEGGHRNFLKTRNELQ